MTPPVHPPADDARSRRGRGAARASMWQLVLLAMAVVLAVGLGLRGRAGSASSPVATDGALAALDRHLARLRTPRARRATTLAQSIDPERPRWNDLRLLALDRADAGDTDGTRLVVDAWRSLALRIEDDHGELERSGRVHLRTVNAHTPARIRRAVRTLRAEVLQDRIRAVLSEEDRPVRTIPHGPETGFARASAMLHVFDRAPIDAPLLKWLAAHRVLAGSVEMPGARTRVKAWLDAHPQMPFPPEPRPLR